MMHGSLNNVDEAIRKFARLEPGFAFLRGMSPELADGKYEISEGAYAMVSTYQTASPVEKKFEAHRKYIDLQYVVAGEEIAHVTDVSSLATAEEYDETRDVAFFHDPVSHETIVLRSGSFAVFHPEDAHRPGMTAGSAPSTVRKVVVKIPVEALPKP
ncbi:MAG: YhcH/YjgK/YiaL family protein [Nitrospinae bacterium]|nr:YhcH/YjgK/YiaL family protein [Nitrospinota bacterium]